MENYKQKNSPKKSLGQNFFVNRSLGEKIADLALETNPDLILEIGPGRGFFTDIFLERGVKVTCVEKDDSLSEQLKLKYRDLSLANEDFMNFDLSKIERHDNIVCFGSLPYNLSKQIIRKCIESDISFKKLYFIIQNEVAEKYESKVPNSNILCLTTSLYAKPKTLFKINPGAFRPQPKVISAFVEFTKVTPDIGLEKSQFKDLAGFIRRAFVSPRKKLKSAVGSMYKGIQETRIEELLEKRPQELALEDFAFLFRNTDAKMALSV